MADFARWIVAAETALPWKAGAFLAAYSGNRKDANETALEASPVAAKMRLLMMVRTEWTGSADQLLGALEQGMSERALRSRAWPKSARSLSSHLRRLAPNLRIVGLDVEFIKSGGVRSIQITRQDVKTCVPCDPSGAEPSDSEGLTGDATGDASRDANEPGTQTEPAGTQTDPAASARGNGGWDARDARDAKKPALSGDGPADSVEESDDPTLGGLF